MEHSHGSFTPFHDAAGGSLYFGGKETLKRSQDGGVTWTSVGATGSCSTLFGSASALYAQVFGGTAIQSAPLSDPTTWTTTAGPSHESWGVELHRLASPRRFDGQHWVTLKAEYGKCSNNCQPARSPLLANGEVWRYIEP